MLSWSLLAARQELSPFAIGEVCKRLFVCPGTGVINKRELLDAMPLNMVFVFSADHNRTQNTNGGKPMRATMKIELQCSLARLSPVNIPDQMNSPPFGSRQA